MPSNATFRSTGWRLLVVLAYLARPVSCIVALNSVRLADGDPYGGPDPHGFGLLFGVASTLVLAIPVFWLLLSRHRDRDRPVIHWTARPAGVAAAAAVVVIVGMPLVTQYAYLRNLPLANSWPIVISSVVWFAIVARLSIAPVGPDTVSIHHSFARSPYLAWTIVSMIGLAKAWIVLPWLVAR